MNLEFIKCDGENENLVDTIYNILRLCGEDMYSRLGLRHWKRPYGHDRIADDCRNKSVFLVRDTDSGAFVSTFMLSLAPSGFFTDNIAAVYLSKFATAPEYSGKGIGGRCLDFMENFAKKNNVSRIRFDVYSESHDTIRFYENKGFKTLFPAKTTNFTVYCMEKIIYPEG